MKKSWIKRGTSQLKKTPFKKKLPKKTKRAKKMEMKRELCEQYLLPNLICQRWGTNKGFTRTDLLRGMLWNVFSKYIRHRDTGICISCGAKKTYEELQAGHYAPVGETSVLLWFDEKNVNGECEGCNAFDSFHLIPMRKNLIKKWGEEEVLRIESIKDAKSTVKIEEVEYAQRIRFYLEKLKEYN